MPQDKENKLILLFEEIDIDDIPFVGGKNASLGEMIRNLKSKGIKIPEGFAITSYAYDYFIKNAGIEKKIKEILKDLDTNIYENLGTRGEKIRHAIIEAEFPDELKKEIIKAYGKLEEMYGKNVDVAVRSSATAEDLPDASFAGQQETFLNITGADALIMACKKCFASLFTNRAISYRHDKGFDHFSVKLSIGVQKMARSDTGSSGVIFTIDTESGFKDVVLVTSIFGLGENIVQGTVNPD
ncbi:MAG: phosphoenolpyruvate synthase, partial [Candidatus Methanofastidiosa archaeon]|nr:phosphoenolpyruvate synthase [Candidatus Methanofastidiosa archaeon]